MRKLEKIRRKWRKLNKAAKRRVAAVAGVEITGAPNTTETELDLAFANWLDRVHSASSDALGQATLDLANGLDMVHKAIMAELKKVEAALRGRAAMWAGIAVAVMLAYGYAKRGGK